MATTVDLYGRSIIYTSVDTIDESNVETVLDDALKIHNNNVKQIDYLYDYFRGKTDILERTKEIRDDILNKINENRAKEIVDFKTAHLVGEDVVYSSFAEDTSEDVDTLNQFMRIEGLSTTNYSLVEWQNIAGVGVKLVLPKTDENDPNADNPDAESNNPYTTEGDAPFTVDSVDPRQAFAIYSSGVHRQQVAGVYQTTDDDDVTTHWVYTHTKCFKLIDGKLDSTFDWTLWYFPIVEYPANNARLGAFEVVIPLLDAINELDSNRMDGIEQFIQALLVLINCKLPEGMNAKAVAENGLLELISDASNPAKVEMLCQQLDQQQTQTLKDDFYDAVLTICSMPNRHSSSSSSDNGIAVVYRDGWASAENASRTSQKMFEKSEYQTLRLVLTICRETGTLDIPLKNIKIDFTRNHYENMETKTTVLIQLLSNEKVHPLVAYEVCGLFADPNAKYLMGMEWYKQQGQLAGTEDTVETEVIDEPMAETDII